MNTRMPAVAGLFYSDDPGQLAAEVDSYLTDDKDTHLEQQPRALIVPHAGYAFSGAIAARAFALLAPWRAQITRVVVLGVAHRVYIRGLALPSASRFMTHLGDIPVDTEEVRRLSQDYGININDGVHAPEHSLEVQLPFLQRSLDHFRLVPIVAGDCDPAEIQPILQRYWHQADTLLVISTDLSHYLSDPEARTLDRQTADAVLQLIPEQIGESQACGRIPLKALLSVAREQGARICELAVGNSGDITGDRHRVVGYGAWVVS